MHTTTRRSRQGRRAPRVWVLILGAFTALALPSFAQQASFQETTSVVVVEVPVNVTRDDEAVSGLTKENFTILDGGKAQEILSIEVVDLSVARPSEEPPAVPIAARRHFLLLFDLAFSTPAAIVKARSAARELLDQLHPTDVAGVGLYSASRGVQFILGFTSDRRQVDLALQTLGVPDLIERAPDPLGLYLGDLHQQAMDGLTTSAGRGRGMGGDLSRLAEDQLRSLVESAAASERASDENRIRSMTDDLSSMAEIMAGIQGRKHVVYLSEGFDSSLLLGDGGQDLQSRSARESGELWDVDTEAIYGSTRLQNQLESMLEALRRAGCVIQAVDIGGMRAEGDFQKRVAGETGLFVMANDTGGEFFRNFNHLGEAMSEMLVRTSVTYLLTFQPRKIVFDGKFHRLKVKLRDVPRGTEVHHRAGYFAPRPFAETAERERQLNAAELILSGEMGGAIAAHLLAAPFPVAGEDAYVPLLIEVDGPTLLEDLSGEVVPVELYVYAMDPEGTVQDFTTQSLGVDREKTTPALDQGGLKFWAHLDLPAGDFSLRVLVRNVQTGRYALRQVPIRVPEFEDGEPFLLAPLFPESPGKWALIREEPERRRDVPYPFMAGEHPYIPASGPVVPSRGSTEVYVAGFNLGSDELEIEARVNAADGTPATAASFRPEEWMPEAGGARALKAYLETSKLPAGIYTLTVKVSAGGEELSSSVRFLVET